MSAPALAPTPPAAEPALSPYTPLYTGTLRRTAGVITGILSHPADDGAHITLQAEPGPDGSLRIIGHCPPWKCHGSLNAERTEMKLYTGMIHLTLSCVFRDGAYHLVETDYAVDKGFALPGEKVV